MKYQDRNKTYVVDEYSLTKCKLLKDAELTQCNFVYRHKVSTYVTLALTSNYTEIDKQETVLPIYLRRQRDDVISWTQITNAINASQIRLALELASMKGQR